MPRTIIATPDAPSSPQYSQGLKAGETIQDQTRQALTSCAAILEARGASLDDVVGWAYCSPIRATSRA